MRRSTARRHFGMKVKEQIGEWEPIPPHHTIDSVQPPDYFAAAPDDPPDPMALVRKPVTSAQLVDVERGVVSEADCARLTEDGKVVHGTYGEVTCDGVPLEYLALLRPSAEGVAAVHKLLPDDHPGDTNTGTGRGTLLVFGAGQPAGLAAVQLGTAKGCAVVAVVGGEHSGNDDLCDIVKGLAREPGCVVPEEYAMVKQSLRDLVKTVTHPTPPESYDTDVFLQDFQQNLLDYIATYPDTLPAAVDRDELVFKGKDKDRTYFKENMETYLEQFAKGASPIPEEDVLQKFPLQQYAIFKNKFHTQTTNVISGDDTGDFDPTDIVKHMISYPEHDDSKPSNTICGDFVPYHFDIRNTQPTHFDVRNSKRSEEPDYEPRPILGAVVAVTPYLKTACEAVHQAGTSLRDKAEALQFLTAAERNAFAAAASVCALAGPDNVVVVGGSLPGLDGVVVRPEDVEEAVRSMEIADDEEDSKLNYFVQVYRAGDFPVYADYAVHRASEVLAGPRQVVVTK